MSERPLFENTDEQEAAYAPQQLPENSAARQAVNVDGGPRTVETVLLPGAIAGGASAGGMGPSVGAGTGSGVAPAAGIAGVTDQLDDEDSKQRIRR